MSLTHSYTTNTLRKIDYNAIIKLLGFSVATYNTDLKKNCEKEIIRRNPALLEKQAAITFNSKLSPREFDKKSTEALKKFAIKLNKKYDFSKETAALLSKKSRYFKAHNLLNSKKEPKTGGGVRDGSYAIDRVISWRLGNDIYSLTILLEKNMPTSNAKFHVYAPKLHLGKIYKPLSKLRIKLDHNDELGLVQGGAEFKTLNEAMDFYEELMLKVAPRLF